MAQLQQQPLLTVWPGRERRTGRRVWAVESRSRSEKHQFPTFHLVYFDFRAGVWRCPCEARRDCAHMVAASDASKREKEAEFAADEARRASAISAKRATLDAQQERDRQMHEAATGRDIFDEPGLGERMTEEDWLRDRVAALPVMGSNAVHTLR